MRGSPLFKSILVLIGLVASGLGLVRLTGAKAAEPIAAPIASLVESSSKSIFYRLSLSAEPSEIRINGATELEGTLPDPTEVVSLSVRWKTPPAPGEQRFAKLTLEPQGKDTITHVFDAPGDIDDIFELP